MFLAKILLGLPLIVAGALALSWPWAMSVPSPAKWRGCGAAALAAGIIIFSL